MQCKECSGDAVARLSDGQPPCGGNDGVCSLHWAIAEADGVVSGPGRSEVERREEEAEVLAVASPAAIAAGLHLTPRGWRWV